MGGVGGVCVGGHAGGVQAGPGAVDAGVGVGLPPALGVKCADICWGFFVSWSE